MARTYTYLPPPPPTWGKLERQIAEPKMTPIEDIYYRLKLWLSRTLFPQPLLYDSSYSPTASIHATAWSSGTWVCWVSAVKCAKKLPETSFLRLGRFSWFSQLTHKKTLATDAESVFANVAGKPPFVDPVAMRVSVHGFRVSALACAGRGEAPTGARQRAANTAGARYSSAECGLASL
jgi:hypothetical protein